MVDAGVEEHVVHDVIVEARLLQHVRQPAIAPPVERHGAAAMRDDEAQLGEARKQIAFHQLHEGHRIGRKVEPSGGVHRGVATARDVNHRGHVQLAHRFVDREPVFVRQRRMLEMPAARIGVQVAADHAEFLDTAPQFPDARLEPAPGALRQHAHAREGAGEQLRDAVDQIVAFLGPCFRYVLIPLMMRHPAGPGREDGEVGAALLDQFELVFLDRRADLVVRDIGIAWGRRARFISGQLRGAPFVVLRRGGGVVAVAIDHHRHRAFPSSSLLWAAAR